MSSVSRWSYQNTAVIRPFVSHDSWSGQTTYGAEYEIACTWTAASEQERDNNGAEFVARHIVYTEDKRPKYLDLIMLGGKVVSDGSGDVVVSPDIAGGETGRIWEEVRSITEWDMSSLGEADSPDFKLATM